MRLYKLIGLEIEALLKEHDKTLKNIATYENILGSRTAMAKVIIKELDAFKKEYAKERKTVIDNVEAAVVEEKKIEEMDVVFLMDRFGYGRTVDVPTYERNKEAADSENKCVVLCRNTDKLCLFTDTGKMHSIKVLDLPFGKFRDKGQPLDNISNYDSSQENIVYLMNLQKLAEHKVFFGTKNGMCKVVDGSEFDVAKRTIAATKLSDEDILLTVRVLEGDETLVLRSDKEYFLRLEAEEIPQKKKGAVGVRGMRLAAHEQMQEIYVLPPDEESVVTVKEKRGGTAQTSYRKERYQRRKEMTYDEAVEFADSTKKYGSILGLESIRNLMQELGNVQEQLHIIHVAGTNGKGSVCAFLSAALTEAGYRVGRYNSPAVFERREVFRIGETMISKEEYAAVFERVQTACEALKKRGCPHPTVFEVETAAAFLWFYEKKCDLVLLETGMGGETDATNLITHPVCSVLTSIGMDHMQYLGNTIEEIAKVKAGIIKKDVR